MKRNNTDVISLQALLETLKDLAVSFGDIHIMQNVKCLRVEYPATLGYFIYM